MNELHISSTTFPADPLPESRWLRFIQGKDVDLEAVNTKTFLGCCFVDMYRKNPEQAVKEMRESAADNEAMVIKVIGLDNYKKIL